MTIKKKSKYKYNFSKSFNKNIKLHFLHWSNKNIIEYIKKNNIKGIILTGSIYRILENNIADLPKKILKLKIPILGICYGYQWLIKNTCGKKCLNSFPNNKNSKYQIKQKIIKPFIVKNKIYQFNHHDYIKKIPKHWEILIKKENQILMAYDKRKKIIGIQFHPESIKKTRKHFFKQWIKYIL
jgi:GMP synthase (glutamine-hydrolysing)